jgi:predicted acetyltransferase
VTFEGGDNTLLHAVLPERLFALESLHTWMIRVVSPKLALAQRGYPAVSARIVLRLSDAALPENSGAYELTLSKGAPKVRQIDTEKGVQITERGLAALYAGYQSPAVLRTLGHLACTNEESRTLAAVFGGYAPQMADMF